MRVVHFSDLHLQAQFAWLGAQGETARKRRRALRDTLLNIVTLAKEVGADALLSGGDLFEHDYVTPDNDGEFLRETFESLAPMRVFLAPGNHDWYGPRSLYRLVKWSSNVHVFTESQLQPVPLAEGVTLWGAAHTSAAMPTDFLEGFQVRGEGIHLALFHGSERSWFTEQEQGKAPHAPFDATQITSAGFIHAFLGHYHTPRLADYHTYPGNPDPLTFGERGERGAIVVTVGEDGTIQRQRRAVAVTKIHDFDLDISGMRTEQQMRDAMRALIRDREGIARVTLVGELYPGVDIRLEELAQEREQLDAVRLRVGDLHLGIDLEERSIDDLAHEATVRGHFVKDVLGDALDAQVQRRILLAGLRAFAGRTDLDVI